ncbi:hypothetical protein NL676_002219 [Syzygium grande]|nr:hypothetical protein NL676_002219 [Syzygium grande]
MNGTAGDRNLTETPARKRNFRMGRGNSTPAIPRRREPAEGVKLVGWPIVLTGRHRTGKKRRQDPSFFPDIVRRFRPSRPHRSTASDEAGVAVTV